MPAFCGGNDKEVVFLLKRGAIRVDDKIHCRQFMVEPGEDIKLRKIMQLPAHGFCFQLQIRMDEKRNENLIKIRYDLSLTLYP